MAELVHDPVNRVRYAFQRDGENLIVAARSIRAARCPLIGTRVR
jgi:hypothetical protein